MRVMTILAVILKKTKQGLQRFKCQCTQLERYHFVGILSQHTNLV